MNVQLRCTTELCSLGICEVIVDISWTTAVIVHLNCTFAGGHRKAYKLAEAAHIVCFCTMRSTILSASIFLPVILGTAAFGTPRRPHVPRVQINHSAISVPMPVWGMHHNGQRSAAIKKKLEKNALVPEEVKAIADVTGLLSSETALRSAVKALVWRLLAGSVTFITTLHLTCSLVPALQVLGGDFCSKLLTMFVGERLMNQSQAGRTNGDESARRSLAKALIWRVFAISNTVAMATIISRDLSIAYQIAYTDAVFKTALMYFYERMWASVEWGKV
jgi:uncharacterized membrane protein